jgi:hypothetical protein
MKVAFLHSDKPRERLLADAFLTGARRHGHDTAAVSLGDEPPPGSFDVVAMVGVKSRERFTAHHRAGAHIVYFDKGYTRAKSTGPVRGWEYWRFALDAHHPTVAIARQALPDDRVERMGWKLSPWRRKGSHVVFAGSSAKYHEFYGLREPTPYAERITREIRTHDRPVIYRPKPSWHDAEPIPGSGYSLLPETLEQILVGAHALVTHGSNACFEAVLAGVPCIILGDGVAKPLSSTSLDELDAPRLASEEERRQWLANLAYWQWTRAELADGSAWQFIGEQIHAQP